MKMLKVVSYSLLFLIFWGCSNQEDAIVENGINRSENLKNTGKSANDFLSAAKYQSLVIEVSYVQSLRPNAQTLVNLKNFLEARLNKPGGITIIEQQIPGQSGDPFTIQEISKIEDQFRTKYNNVGILTLHLLFLNGGFTEDTNTSRTLGVAYRNTSCVLFENSIHSLSDQLTEPNRVDLETTVITHEIAHLLGLVDLGSNMQNDHIDEAHGKHCDNADCLMFWQIENNNVVGMMSSGNIPQLDANCILDLQANGGK